MRTSHANRRPTRPRVRALPPGWLVAAVALAPFLLASCTDAQNACDHPPVSVSARYFRVVLARSPDQPDGHPAGIITEHQPPDARRPLAHTNPDRLPDSRPARTLGGGVGFRTGGRFRRVRGQPDDGDRLHAPHGSGGSARGAHQGRRLTDLPVRVELVRWGADRPTARLAPGPPASDTVRDELLDRDQLPPQGRTPVPWPAAPPAAAPPPHHGRR